MIAQELFTENNNLKSIADSKRNLREYFQKYGFKPEDFAQVSAPEQDSHSSGATETSEEEGQVGQGTGFLIGSKGHIITNYHVIEESTELISVTFPDGKEYSAKVISKHISNDLAILNLDKYDTKAHKSNLIIGDSTKAHIGEKVFTIGYPDISILGQQPKYSEGIIASIAGEKDDPTLFQISVPIQSGNSGGPLFNLRGEVIGVTSSGFGIIADEGGNLDVLQNVNYAVKSSLLKNLIQMLPKEAHPRVTSNLGNDHSAIIDSVKPNIVFILVA